MCTGVRHLLLAEERGGLIVNVVFYTPVVSVAFVITKVSIAVVTIGADPYIYRDSISRPIKSMNVLLYR